MIHNCNHHSKLQNLSNTNKFDSDFSRVSACQIGGGFLVVKGGADPKVLFWNIFVIESFAFQTVEFVSEAAPGEAQTLQEYQFGFQTEPTPDVDIPEASPSAPSAAISTPVQSNEPLFAGAAVPTSSTQPTPTKALEVSF